MAEKHTMDQKTRDKLCGLLPFSRTATRKFIPDLYSDDIPLEYRPVFTLRPFTRDEIKKAQAIMSNIAKSDGEDPKDEEDLNECARKIVVGWDNLYDVGTGDNIEYIKDDDGGADKYLFEILPVSIKASLLSEAVKISGLMNLSKLGLKS